MTCTGQWKIGFAALVALVAATPPAAAAIDLTGRWYVEQHPGAPTFVDIVQTGATVSLTFADSGLTFTGTVATPQLFASLPGCVPPSCFTGLSARVLPNGMWWDGRLVFGAPPLPGVARVLARRCECVDGNTTDGDGCDAQCRVEPCFTCTGEPLVCAPIADGGNCSDRRDCTTGETCSAGVCGGGTPLPACVDMSGLWDVSSSSDFGTFDSVVRIAQEDGVVLFRDAVSGVPGALGTIDAAGAFALQLPSTGLLCTEFGTSNGTVAPGGATYDASGITWLDTVHTCVRTAVSSTGTRHECGNGELDAGEGCDDGNRESGDGCDVNCQPTGCGNGVAHDGEQCDDGNTTAGDGCGPDCTVEPCWTCSASAPTACAADVRSTCAAPATPHRAVLTLRNAGAMRAISVRSGATAPRAGTDLGNPLVGGSHYDLCLFDRSQPTPRVLFGTRVATGGQCGRRPCWRPVPGGFAYHNMGTGKTGSMTKLFVIGDRHGAGAVQVSGHGAALAVGPGGFPALPLPVPLTVQVQSPITPTSCYTIDFSAAGIIRNDPATGRFSARGAP